jgi:NitT/TauT family transport system substrate-binding protein
MLPDLKALQSNVNITKDLGFVKDDIKVENYSDLSVVQDALKRLK